eukprot:TRINITY_DN1720_c0_g1_i4.p1 TRINITY_DN1720_c0_g1~~TRINITY_DN1720_c0_g1_i4.p1  ORF type:complete len:360 (-),score=68.53 TRINITY_DN1720_c0_g1_i4:137-1216(-)
MHRTRSVVCAEDASLLAFCGFFHSHQTAYRVRVAFHPHRPPPSQSQLNQHGLAPFVSIEACPALSRLLTPHAHAVATRMQNCTSIRAFLSELTHLILDRSRVRLVRLDDSFSRIALEITDTSGRPHELEISLPPDYPARAPTCSACTPKPFVCPWPLDSAAAAEKGPLATLMERYRAHVEGFAEFWAVMEEMDAECCVLEPDMPTRADTSRRMALPDHCSILVHINPDSPFQICECRFLGAESTVNDLCQRLHVNISKWQTSRTPLANLREVLNVEFPARSSEAFEESGMECAICYSSRVNNLLPDRVCDDENCRKAFHSRCLLEWLRSVPSSQQSFDTMFGRCPYCTYPINVKVSLAL